MGQSGDGVTNQLLASARCYLAPLHTVTPGSSSYSQTWPRGCPMIDNLLKIQILVFVPRPSPRVCGCVGGGAVWPVPALLLLSPASPRHCTPQPGQQSQCGPSIHYLHICCWGGDLALAGELAWDTRYGLQMHYYTGEKFLNFIRHYILI